MEIILNKLKKAIQFRGSRNKTASVFLKSIGGNSSVEFISDKLFKGYLKTVTFIVLIILVGIFITLVVVSISSIKEFGLKFFISNEWNLRKNEVLSVIKTEDLGENSYIIEFSQDVEPLTVNEDNIYFVNVEGKKVFPLNIEMLSETSSNLYMIYEDSDLTEGQEFSLYIDEDIYDENNNPLSQSYLYQIAYGEAPGLLVNPDTGEEVVYVQDQDDASKWFGAVPFMLGTLITSFLALLISMPFSIAISIFLGEYFTYGPLSTVMKTTNELLAGIPSVIYGFWAYGFLVPKFGSNLLTASVVLSIMIIPYSASLAREVISLVPKDIKEAAYAMGATRYEVIKRVIVPYAGSGIFAGILLSLGRALGETMAVTMVIGNSNRVPEGLFSKGQTIASLIANEYNEAKDVQLSSLTELGLLLFLITMVTGLLGRFFIRKLSIKDKA